MWGHRSGLGSGLAPNSSSAAGTGLASVGRKADHDPAATELLQMPDVSPAGAREGVGLQVLQVLQVTKTDEPGALR